MRKQLFIYFFLILSIDITLLSVSIIVQKPKPKDKDVAFTTYFKKTYPLMALCCLSWNVHLMRTFPHFHTLPKALASLATVPLIGSLGIAAYFCSKNNKDFMKNSFENDLQRRQAKRNSFILNDE